MKFLTVVCAACIMMLNACSSSGTQDNYNDHAEPDSAAAPMGTPVDTAEGLLPTATDTMLNDTTHIR